MPQNHQNPKITSGRTCQTVDNLELGGPSQLGYVVNNHAATKSPKDAVGGTPSKWPNFTAHSHASWRNVWHQLAPCMIYLPALTTKINQTCRYKYTVWVIPKYVNFLSLPISNHTWCHNRILKGGWWFPQSFLMFPKVPQCSLGILRVP